MRSNLRCGLFTCALTLVGALLLRTTLLSHNYAEQQYHALRGHASRQAALRDARGAAAALVDAVATRPPGEAIVRGAGNATDLEALIWGNASTCADEMRSLSFVSEECGWTPGQDLVDDFLGAATVLGIDIEVSNDALKGIGAFYSYRKSSHSYRDGAFTFVPCCKCASESFFEAFRSIQKKITLNAAHSMISTPPRKVAHLPSLGTRSHISARATLRWSGVSARASKKLATGIWGT